MTARNTGPMKAMDLNSAFRGGAHSIEFLEEINRTSLIALAEAGIVSSEVARRIAVAMRAILPADGAASPWAADYLDYERHLVAKGGAEASLLHSGRSRQDIAATIARMNLREGLLGQIDALLAAREQVLRQAERYKGAIIPAYTHGVQAQPTTYGHYLLALHDALARTSVRLHQAYSAVDLCPLGTAALATSSYPIDRARLAQLLGFERLLENAYDANHFAPVDSALQVAAALGIAAVQIGQFCQDIHAQYGDPHPWLLLGAGDLLGSSSIMPQKRNPAAVEALRGQCSLLLGEMQAVPLMSHNIGSGMFDYRAYDPVPAGRATTVFGLLGKVVSGLVLDEARALAEVHADYSTTTEIADTLLRRCGVPFRVGHHFASVLTDHGRKHRLRLADIPFDDVARLYRETNDADIPLHPAAFAESISPRYMVDSRVGLGGPQAGEMDRMLARATREQLDDAAWIAQCKTRLADAGRMRDDAFDALLA